MELSNLHVHVGKIGDEWCLSWEFKGDKYHIWLMSETFEPKPCVGRPHKALYKTAADAKDVRFLSLAIQKNANMVAAALEQAKAEKLFEKCEQELAEIERKRLERAAADYKITLAKQAGPQMLEALRELVAAIQDGLRRHGAGDANAIASDMIGATVRQAEAAIRQAETGGKVEL